MINPIDFAALSPLLIVLGGALLLLFLETFFDLLSWGTWVTLLVLVAAFCAEWIAPTSENALLTPWIKFDGLARFFTLFFIATGIGVTLLSASFFQRFEPLGGEYYFLLLSAIFGLILIGASADFLTLFIGLETLSIASYVLVGYMKSWAPSHESAMKYFLLGALGTAFLLYGIALIYGAAGFTHFDGLLEKTDSLLFAGGIALVTVGFAFKAAIVPFHSWAPDVYDGAMTPITAFMAVGTKVGAFAALTRVFLVALPNFNPIWNEGVAVLAILTLVYANYVAMRQTLLRRFFAYSGISHAGFLLIPFIANTPDALSALMFYLVVYALATFGCFAVLAYLDDKSVGVTLNDLRGLYKRAPWVAAIFALCLLTLAGIPPTVGFFAKFYLFKIAYEAGYYTIVFVALLTTILSAYYYLRFIPYMFSETAEKKLPVSWPAVLVGGVASLAIVVLSVYPTLLAV